MTMQCELFLIFDRPAIYRRTNDEETCVAWNREQARFEEDDEALRLVHSGSTDVRRIDGDTARLAIARLLARHESGRESPQLRELQEMEAEAARKRVPLSDVDKRRRSQIVAEVMESASVERAVAALSAEEKALLG